MSRIYEKIEHFAACAPGHKAFTYRIGEQYESVDYAALKSCVDSLAASLREYKGGTIAIIGNNKLEYAVALLAVLCHTGNAFLIDKELGRGDIERIFEQKKPDLILLDEELALTFDGYRTMGFSEVSMLMREQKSCEPDPSFAGSLILHTSGTTGEPKCVLLSEGNYYSVIPELNRKWGVKPEHSCLFIIPLYHIYALTSLFHGLYAGIENILEWDFKHLGRVLSETKPRLIMGVPLMYNKIRDAAFEKAGVKVRLAVSVSNLLLKAGIDIRRKLFREIYGYFGGEYYFGVSAGSLLPYETSRFFNDIGLPVYNVYGMTETAGPVAINYKDHNRYDSVGEILDNNEVRVEEPGADGVGRVCVRGRNVFCGYLGEQSSDDHATANREHDKELPFFDTGDLGFIKDGYLYISGRRKNILIGANGKNISPEELNRKILENTGIHDCNVVMEDNRLIAVINTELTEAAVQKHIDKINAGLPKYKRLSGFRITDKKIK